MGNDGTTVSDMGRERSRSWTDIERWIDRAPRYLRRPFQFHNIVGRLLGRMESLQTL